MPMLRVASWLSFFGLLVGALLTGNNPADAQENAFRAGAHAMDITPQKFPISVNGGMQDRQATAARDHLHARCLVLDDGKTRIAFAVCDSCMIPRELTDEAKRLASQATGIPPENILISATHTHTAPTVAGVFQSDPNMDYRKYLVERIAQGIAKANANRMPAKVGWGVGQDPTQVFNRRWKMKTGTIAADPFGRLTDAVKMNPGYKNPGLVEPAGPTDPDVSILSVQTATGRPLALLANYSLHYVGGAQPLSADYFGAFAERMAALLQAGSAEPAFVGIMSNGTSGDINNINFAAASPGKLGEGEKMRVVANSVAQAAFAAYQKIEHRSKVSLAAAEKELEFAVRKPNAEEVARARAIMAAAKDKGLKTLAEIYARETILLADYPNTVRLKVQALRVGELGIAAIPCETFVEIGLEIKKKSPLRPTCTIELANGYNGYLPTPEQHKLGGYETWRARSSYLEVEAAPKITATVLDLLAKVEK